MYCWKRVVRSLAGLLFLLLFACSHQTILTKNIAQDIYLVELSEESLITQYAPVIRTGSHLNPYDKIGRPSARLERDKKNKIYVDSERPTMYFMEKKFATDEDCYTNLIYRVHFSEIPFRFFPFHLAAGKNVGLMVVITLDSRNRPVLVTTVHTCGCYVAIIPTTWLPNDSFPLGWRKKPLKVYGERLPWVLDYQSFEAPKLLVRLRPDVHRVMDLEIVESQDVNKLVTRVEVAEMIPMNELKQIPVNGGTTSFFYEKGLRKGYVKGAIKPWETLFLSLISLDFFVGTDKAYSDTQKSGNPFYTSLKPWNRKRSDMWYFGEFLKFWGWRL